MKKTSATEGKIIEKDGRRYRETPRRSALPYWVAALVWLIAALFAPMYKLTHLLLILILSLAAALITAKFAPEGVTLVELPFYEGNNDLNRVATQIADARQSLIKARDQIADTHPETAALLSDIETTCGKIQAAVLENPEDLPRIRRFLSYYLPTTEKLAGKYAFAAAQNEDSTNINATIADIENALSLIRSSFKNQLDALFSDDALDVSTDITVLETMLARDNLN